MHRLKRLYAFALTALLLVGLTACDSGGVDEVAPLNVEVRVSFPDEYPVSEAEGATVTATNDERGDTQTAETNAAGVAVFEELIPGPYAFSASLSIEGERAAELTGSSSPRTLNANLPIQSLQRSPSEAIELQLNVTAAGTFVIKEVYYTGSETPEGDTYFRDQFIEIYNNTDERLYADGLYVASIYGASGQINPNTEPTPFQDDQEAAYASNIWRVPGGGTDVPVEPGESIVIAQHGIDHADDPDGNPASPVNLGDADFEMYTGRDQDIDVANVPNMERTYFTGGFYSLVPVFGPAWVLFETDDFDSLEQVPIPDVGFLDPRIRVPNELIIDGFEALQTPTSDNFKRLPLDVDAGFVAASGTYTSESARRLIQREVDGRRILKNTNNTGSDFEMISAPTPRSFD
jgi:hypothetical protein